MQKKVFSFDAETDGLWGNPFSIAAIVYQQKISRSLYKSFPSLNSASDSKFIKHLEGGEEAPESTENVFYSVVEEKEWQEVDRFISRLPDSIVSDKWVKDNVLPTLDNIEVTHKGYEDMIKDFADFYKSHKQDAECICHMGYIVESHLLREMHRLGAIGDWDAPYPLFDVSGNLQAAGENPTSVDEYVKKHNLEISDYGTSHNPLFDCEVAAKVYFHLLAA